MDEPEARSVSQWWGGPPGGPPLASFSKLLPYTQCGYDLPSGYRRELSRGGTPHSCRAPAERRPRCAGRDRRLLSEPALSLPAAAAGRGEALGHGFFPPPGVCPGPPPRGGGGGAPPLLRGGGGGVPRPGGEP